MNQVEHNYVNGEFVGADAHRENINPSDTNDVVGLFPRSGTDLLDAAVLAAREAQPGWARTSPQARADILERIAERIYRDVEPLAGLLAREEGKTLRESTGEVTRAAQIFRFFSGEALRLTGTRQASTRPGVTVNTTRDPLGVVGIITPWNFPIAIPAWKAAPALAYGNAVVMKPAELTPASALALARIMHECGLPAGVFNLVMGQGSVLGDAMVTHPGIDAMTFTGSGGVGVGIARLAAERLMPVQLELGGKNPLLIAEDADLELAVACAVDGAFFATGQRCTASSRLIVHERVHDEFVEKMRVAIGALRVGDARAPETDIGPVVDASQLRTDTDYLDIARGEAELVIGGELLELSTPGHYLSPALIVGVDNDCRTSREEIFGPVASVIRVGSHDEAVAVANDTPYGLSAGICTTSLRFAEDFQARSEAGMVMVNLPTAGVDPHVSFGGRKMSSYGPKEQGSAAREFFTQSKTAYVLP